MTSMIRNISIGRSSSGRKLFDNGGERGFHKVVKVGQGDDASVTEVSLETECENTMTESCSEATSSPAKTPRRSNSSRRGLRGSKNMLSKPSSDRSLRCKASSSSEDALTSFASSLAEMVPKTWTSKICDKPENRRRTKASSYSLLFCYRLASK